MQDSFHATSLRQSQSETFWLPRYTAPNGFYTFQPRVRRGGDSVHPSAQEPQYNGAVFEEHWYGKGARRPGKFALQTGGGRVD